MAIRNKMRANAEPFLQPGETVQAVFGAQTTSQWFALISWWIIIIRNSFRVVVVTDRRILVFRSGRFRMTPVKELRHELPRNTRIGPAKGLWLKCESLGERLYIHKRFHKDVEAADALLPAEANPPVETSPMPNPEGVAATEGSPTAASSLPPGR
jgi:hypothetical protein